MRLDTAPLRVCLQSTIAKALPLKQAVREDNEKCATSERQATFSSLENAITSYMIQKIAKAGLSYTALKKVHNDLKSKGVVALLAGDDEKPRVTAKSDILAKIVYYLSK